MRFSIVNKRFLARVEVGLSLRVECNSNSNTMILEKIAVARIVLVVKQIKYKYLRHLNVLHSLVSMLSPTQSAPPFAGAGFVQVLDLVWIPPSQSSEHSDQSPKSVYPPSTVRMNVSEIKCL